MQPASVTVTGGSQEMIDSTATSSRRQLNIAGESPQQTCDELDVLNQLLPLDGASLLELGCGTAEKTRAIARQGRVASIAAFEVDEIQHRKHLEITDLPNVSFRYGGAERIDEPDMSFDCVVMFKSLHHVPMAAMDAALGEIARVLKPGGYAYISEPVYAGAFNDILRLFHDEQAVREAAFRAIVRAADSGQLISVAQRFFNVVNHFDDFGQFADRVLGVTHTQHVLDEATRAEVRRRFDAHMHGSGADLLQPIRVDLLRRPPTA